MQLWVKLVVILHNFIRFSSLFYQFIWKIAKYLPLLFFLIAMIELTFIPWYQCNSYFHNDKREYYQENIQLSLMWWKFLYDYDTWKPPNIQGDEKITWLFLGEIIQPNLLKFAYNLIRGRWVRIWTPIWTISIPSVPKSRFKFPKNSKNHFVRFFY